ncbi:MAG: aspartyl protease family protein [Nonlabens sp.]|uniref:aspartyl protease family protein n=1 Tax=Nonlabens sp. TaxID=1888209 RepID=UPI003EFAAAEE
MKNLLYIFSLFLITSCSSLDNIFNEGGVLQESYNEQIPFNYSYNLALVNVEINGKEYTFLIDTGAPTVISQEIFDDLNIKAKKSISVGDSQGQSNMQKVAVVPEMKLGDLIYQDTGAVVANLRDIFEFDCMEIDGILGANQMAKSFWKFDYQNKEVTITDDLSNYKVDAYPNKFSFYYNSQRTPKFKLQVNGIETTMTFDTGFAGNMDIKKSISKFEKSKGYTEYGNSSVGLYGARDSVNQRVIKLDSLQLGNLKIGPQIVTLDDGGLLGNDFMNKHDMIIDWPHKTIYLKPIAELEPAVESSFGFAMRVKNNKVIVSSLIKELPIELELGDQIISIDNHRFDNLNDTSSCNIYTNFELSEIQSIDKLTYKRDSTIYHTSLSRKNIIN